LGWIITPSPPQRKATPVIPAPWNRSPTSEEVPLPPIRKITKPSSLDLIPLPWDIPPFPRETPQPSPPVKPTSPLPIIISMTPSRTTPLLPRHPDSRTLPRSQPTPPEWKEFQSPSQLGKRKELSPPPEPSLPKASSSRLPRPAPIRTTPLFEKHEEFTSEEGPSWKQPSPSTGKRRESPRHVAMPLKRERSDPHLERSMSPEEQPTPPDSPKRIPTPPYYPEGSSPSRPIAMLKRSPTPSGLSTPSSLGLGSLYRTPVQTIVELEDEVMEEGEVPNSDSSMEEGQITDTRQSTPDSMDIGIPRVPSDWLQPDSP